jgi:hypothetical protein
MFLLGAAIPYPNDHASLKTLKNGQIPRLWRVLGVHSSSHSPSIRNIKVEICRGETESAKGNYRKPGDARLATADIWGAHRLHSMLYQPADDTLLHM